MSDFEIDHGRQERLGFPEVIYGEGKSEDQLEGILEEYRQQQQNVLITRLQKNKARYLREPKAAAGLRHPNIVPIYEASLDGDAFFVAQFFLDGLYLLAQIVFALVGIHLFFDSSAHLLLGVKAL